MLYNGFDVTAKVNVTDRATIANTNAVEKFEQKTRIASVPQTPGRGTDQS